jgi:formate hydrogenlyase subunit 3/multisubunit Na+/H+ antiporter MnhD subunit
MRGLMYYFWLSFIGSIFFIVPLIINSIFFPSADFYLIYLQTFINIKPFFSILSSSFIFIGFSLKMGGFFFFFFKSDLYKLLPAQGIILFSIYTSFFYLLLLFYLSAKIVFFAFCFRMIISAIIFVLSLYSLIFGNLTQRNILLLAGFSTVLTICFCILIVL